MKNILSTLLFPLFMGVPYFRGLASYSGEFKDVGSPCDSLRADSCHFADQACFYKIYTFRNNADYIIEGLYRIIDNKHRIGFADETGKVIIKPIFHYIRPFSGGVAAFNEGGKIIKDKKNIQIEGGKWGFINKKGEIIISPVYDEVEDCKNGEARVILGGMEFILTDLNTEENQEY